MTEGQVRNMVAKEKYYIVQYYIDQYDAGQITWEEAMTHAALHGSSMCRALETVIDNQSRNVGLFSSHVPTDLLRMKK